MRFFSKPNNKSPEGMSFEDFNKMLDEQAGDFENTFGGTEIDK